MYYTLFYLGVYLKFCESIYFLPLSSLPSLSLTLPAPTAVNISVCLSSNRQEAHITCAYISSPLYPRIKINEKSYTVRTLNSTATLNVHYSYYDSTMENVLTLVLHNPRLYEGTVYECYFRLHGGGDVSSGPARLTLTPTEETNASLCSAEDACECCQYYECTCFVSVDFVSY